MLTGREYDRCKKLTEKVLLKNPDLVEEFKKHKMKFYREENDNGDTFAFYETCDITLKEQIIKSIIAWYMNFKKAGVPKEYLNKMLPDILKGELDG